MWRKTVVWALVLPALTFLVACGDGSSHDDDTDETTDDDTADDDDDDGDDGLALGMAYVPAGPFFMGCPEDSDFPNCGPFPEHEVDLPAFYIDIEEVSVADYVRCEDAGTCEEVSSFMRVIADDYPAQCISWYSAGDYCEWAGKRLPTSEEWEKAARGPDGGHRFAWGDEWEPTFANWCDGVECDGSVDGYDGVAPLNAFPENLSPYGVHNMTGNMLEWTSTPSTASGHPDDYVIRGGSFEPPNGMGSPEQALQTWVVNSDAPHFWPPHIGVRCAVDAE
ncbi:MAG: SUMF1/EgtB/PvdO family nonheme iron enzyme [Deltaproteobacteria bacterium]|nr:SUMF1/EgtB/PvdO family nonheme iron enzyme [Deltaproteobacteria bacterium]